MSEKPKRRWYQFSLKTLLVVLTLTGFVLGMAMLPAERQRRATQRVRAMGGSVYFANPRPDESAAASYLRKWLSRDYFDAVIEIDLVGSNVTDGDLKDFQGLTQVQRVFLDDTKVTDDGLAHLAGLVETRSLSLNNTCVTDAGIAHLQRFTKLEILWLDGTQVIGGISAKLQEHPQLRELHLDRTQVTDAAIAHLHGHSQLRELHVGDTLVTDAGVAELKKALPKCYIIRRW